MNLELNLLNYRKFQKFPYHLVESSPWPISVSYALLALATGTVMTFHGIVNSEIVFNIGFILTTYGIILWLRDVIIEGSFLGNHTKEVQKGLELGVILFIVSEGFAFLSIFWAFLHASLAPTIEIGAQWPPMGITPLNPFAIPLLNTVLLLSSGALITYGHHALILGDRKGTILGLFLTIVFALIFTALQYFEYQEASFTIADSVFGSAFFCSTGLHGFHVIVGTLFITWGFFRMIYYHFTRKHHVGLQFAILYWHFVDIVWLFLFVLVYYWTAGSAPIEIVNQTPLDIYLASSFSVIFLNYSINDLNLKIFGLWHKNKILFLISLLRLIRKNCNLNNIIKLFNKVKNF